jgi:hypothetical protein
MELVGICNDILWSRKSHQMFHMKLEIVIYDVGILQIIERLFHFT